MKLAGYHYDNDYDDFDDDNDDNDDDSYVNLYWMLSPADGVPSTRSSNLCLELSYDDDDNDNNFDSLFWCFSMFLDFGSANFEGEKKLQISDTNQVDLTGMTGKVLIPM